MAGRLNCSHCKKTPARKLEWGCEDLSKEGVVLYSDKKTLETITLYRCPIAAKEETHLHPFVTAYNRYQDGFLPNVGGSFDQSHCFLQSLEIIPIELKRVETLDKMEREAKSGKR